MPPFRRRAVPSVFVLAAALLAGVLGVAPAAADDASCKPILDALLAQARTPYRASSTFNGAAGGEEVYTTKAIYRGRGGHWTKIPATPEDRIAANHEVGAAMTNCRLLRADTVDGQTATIYSGHSQTVTPASTTEMQIWIGKANGLPLQVESDVSMFGKKSHTSKHYSYGNVQAPAGVN